MTQNNYPDLGFTVSRTGGGVETFVDGPATPPAGDGSLRLETPATADKVQVLTNQPAGASLRDITAIGFATYRDSTGAVGITPSINMPIDINGGELGSGEFTTLVFEPARTSKALQDGVWQDWDAYGTAGNADGWRSSQALPGIGANNGTTLAAIQAAVPNATILTLGVNQGSSNAGGRSHADALYLNTTRSGVAFARTYDFEFDDNSALVYGLTKSDELVQFRTEAGNAIVAGPRAVSGLATGDDLVGIDVRPETGELYGLTRHVTENTGKLYVIDPDTGAATARATLSTKLEGTRFGLDFNPTVDRLRVISDVRQNVRVHPLDGTVTIDGPLAYAAGDSRAATVPDAVGAAYTNNIALAPPGATTLFDIDIAGADALVRQQPPNDGTLNTVGPTGTTVTRPDASVPVGPLSLRSVGFDVEATTNRAFAVLEDTDDTPEFYAVSLVTGRAVNKGRTPAGVEDITMASPRVLVDDPASLREGTDGSVTIRRVGDRLPALSVSYLVRSPSGVSGSVRSVVLASGQSSVSAPFSAPRDANTTSDVYTIVLTQVVNTSAELNNASLLEDSTASVIVTDDTQVLSLPRDVTTVEGTAAIITVSRSAGDQTSALPVRYSVTTASGAPFATPGQDFTAATDQVVTIPAGASSTRFSIETFQDATAEGIEAFEVRLDPQQAEPAVVDPAASVTRVTIVDDEPNPAPSSAMPTATTSSSATATSTPSATSSPTSSPTSSATSSATSSPSSSPSQDCSRSSGNLPLQINTPTINATGLASVTVTGARPGATVVLQGYSQNHAGSVTFATDSTPSDRVGTADDNGSITFNDLRPASNTRLRAVEADCSFSADGFTAVIEVRAQETLQVRRTAVRSYTFSGNSIPAREGGLIISLYRITGAPCDAGVEPRTCPGEQFIGQSRASATTGSYSIRRVFTSADANRRISFVVKTGRDAQNAPGRSNVRALLIF